MKNPESFGLSPEYNYGENPERRMERKDEGGFDSMVEAAKDRAKENLLTNSTLLIYLRGSRFGEKIAAAGNPEEQKEVAIEFMRKNLNQFRDLETTDDVDVAHVVAMGRALLNEPEFLN